MAAGEASGDICSLLGLELICVVPAGFPAGKPWSWLEGWMEWMVLITSGKRGSGAGSRGGKGRGEGKEERVPKGQKEAAGRAGV